MDVRAMRRSGVYGGMLADWGVCRTGDFWCVGGGRRRACADFGQLTRVKTRLKAVFAQRCFSRWRIVPRGHDYSHRN
jgi:hypothetical protein